MALIKPPGGDVREYVLGSEERLRELFPPHSTVWVTTIKVSRDGMSRDVLVLGTKDNLIVDVTLHVARVLGYKMDRDRGSLRIHGAGMDMHFHLVYSLSRILYADYDTSGEDHRDPGYLLSKTSL